MTHPPLIFRLMLATLFMPIMIGICAAIVAILMHKPADQILFDPSTMLGVPTAWIMIPLFFVLPFILYFWMFMTGNWRRPVLTATLVYGACFINGTFEIVQSYMPPEKRNIYLHGINGTDVYCNGVHLGQLPMTIRVDELMAKVPEWNTPPEQRWYDDATPESRLCTWVPWDHFLKERYEAAQALTEITRDQNVSGTQTPGNISKAAKAQRDVLLKHDAECRYWWSYRFAENQLAFRRGGFWNTHYPFEKQSSYYNGFGGNSFSPSVGFHAQLLADVLPELTPEQKADWDQHVLKNWLLIRESLNRTLMQAAARHKREKNEPLAELYETALHSTARMKYNLSDPPTEEECRRLLADWVKESINYRAFLFGDNWGYPSEPIIEGDVLLPADIKETMRKPLMEQWQKNKYRYTHGWAPIAYFSWQNKSPDYFADFALFSAASNQARIALLENEAPETAALFKTLLYRRSFQKIFYPQIYLYAAQIENYGRVNNPLVERDFREYIVKALADPKHGTDTRQEVEWMVVAVISNRIDRDNVNKDELAAWVSTLPIPVLSKSLALWRLRTRNDRVMTFADRLQEAAKQRVLIETELTFDDVFQWFDENPDGTLFQFLKEQEENISVTEQLPNRGYRDGTIAYPNTVSFTRGVNSQMIVGAQFYAESLGLPHYFVLALLRNDTSDGDPRVRKLIERLWNQSAIYMFEMAIETEYGTSGLITGDNIFRNEFIVDAGSVYLPEYILDLYLSSEPEYRNIDGKDVMKFSMTESLGTTSILALCESPKAEEILEKWLDKKWFHEEDKEARPRIERCLEVWRIRNALRAKKMEFFQDLIAGRMVPDDLLLPQPSWVWKDGEYMQAE